MKIEFTKDHIEHIKGDKAEVKEGLANYLISVGAAKVAKDKEKVEDIKPVSKKEFVDGKEKKEK